MARLNEPPVVGESIEALKRRFMRQNRELAKSNSELKIKVATLEADRAQLLSENITLRDQNIHYKQEQARDYTKRAIQNVGIVKDKLVTKVAELTELMAELETAQSKPPKPEMPANTARRRSYKKSPTQVRNWKSSLCGPEVTGLAPIVEDKYYPRRTLGAEEIQNFQPEISSMTNSPELGSPPVARFDTTESLPSATIQTENEAFRPENEAKEGCDTEPVPLFANLETRRKRRTSGLIRDQTEESEPQKESQANITASQPELLLKAGAKRKFGVREEEDEARRPAVPDNTSFSFSRKSGASSEKSTNRHVKALPERSANKVAERARTVVGEAKARKALGEKTVNTDPMVSPVKIRQVSDKPDNKDLMEKLKERQKQRQQTKSEQKLDKPLPRTIEIPPATPAPVDEDIFSPTESMPSANPGTRDTPPPSELTSKAAENTRPSRRQRAQVSYAEPSLRDKMRRPGKELADAVVTSRTTKDDSGAIKEDEPQLPNWKTLPVENRKQATEPTSPLQSKSSNIEEYLPVTVATDRRRKSSARASDVGVVDLKSDTSRTAIAALMASQRRLSKLRDSEIQSSLEIGSSELLDTSSPEVTGRKESATTKQSRRHSSMADIKSRKEGMSRGQSIANLDSEEIVGVRAERIASRRRSMQI